MKQLEIIRDNFRQADKTQQLLRLAESSEKVEVSGLAGAADVFLIAELFDYLQQTILVVVPTDGLAVKIYENLRPLLAKDNITYFPSWGYYPYDWLVPSDENISSRIETVWQLSKNNPLVVVTTPEALSQPTLDKEKLEQSCFDLEVGKEIDLDEVVEKLATIGYQRESITEEVGTFSVRGGIIDLFPFTSENPIRCEFFGDFIESMRCFSVTSQRSIEKIKKITVIPRRELLLSDDQIDDCIEKLDPTTARVIRTKCYNGFRYPGLEWVSPLFDYQRSFLFDFLPDKHYCYFSDYDFITEKLTQFASECDRLYQEMLEKFPDTPKPPTIYLPEKKINEYFDSHKQVVELPLGRAHDGVNFDIKEHPTFNGQIKILREELDKQHSDNWQTFIVSDNKIQQQRLSELLDEQSEKVNFLVSDLQNGFIFPEIKLTLLTDHQIFARQFIRHRRRRFKEGTAISSYNALNIGDYIVHVDHGIGRYRGLKEININNRRRECLLIIYADDDKLYVPIEEFSRVQKYIGKEGRPRLTKLGSGKWDKIKSRTKKAIADMAEELIALYAKRRALPGLSFNGDDEWMHQLEASFPFQETADQVTAIADVKKDMEKKSPTDRLICGDVGFGKTEVAIRATLKAISSGYQVAVLVPTTILAQQHLSTFTERLNQFPIKIEMLSRFRNRKEQKQIVQELEEGKIDVIIGTHRILQKDLKIPRLGLIIIDEEQRFGVSHKEKLKKIRATVDCLSLSATPIPRTLQMSLLGVRDMSTVNTSPRNRLPITTEISQFDPRIIYEAINDEVARGGQVYFVHNRVQSILSMHLYLSKLLKNLRIAVAHGQMPVKELEDVMLSFLNKEYDILLCTSIIESGIDIPSVNTIIINRADRFGLAQLHQLRGRVGRSMERAFSYLLVPPVRLLTDTARKRLKALEQHTELGSGFHLAMKDLEIRGAGNLLGPQQHGFIEEVGFDLYCSLLDQAVAELKGERIPEVQEVKLEFDCDIYIPEEYIEDSTQRVDIYRKLSDAKNLLDLESIRNELQDRFGSWNSNVENLIEISEIRVLALSRNIVKIKLKDRNLSIFYGDGKLPDKDNIANFRMNAPEDIEFDASETFVISLSFPENVEHPINDVKKLLQLL